ncbi:MAG: glycosyltransferase, partial [Fusobacteriaceae bacterium]
IRWYIIGYGGDEEKIIELIKENSLEDCFIILGKKTNPYPYMNGCDLYVQPSRYEGKAVTVTEAQILARPVLLTNYPTSSSQVSHLKDGYITENSVEGIARGIEVLYGDSVLRETLKKNCERVDFSNSAQLEKLYKLFESGEDSV